MAVGTDRPAAPARSSRALLLVAVLLIAANLRATITGIDPATRHVETTAGAVDADVLVVALGADLRPEATPGLVEGGNEFYTVAGAFRARDVLADFPGGRVVVAVTSTPFKCPPAPSETALLVHEMLEARGLLDRSEISLVMPLGKPIPPSPAASEAVLAAFAERGITCVAFGSYDEPRASYHTVLVLTGDGTWRIELVEEVGGI